MPMQGLTAATLPKHPALIPLFTAIGGGMALAFGYLGRLATKCPDVCWDRASSYPYEKYANKQYKFYSENIDYKNLKQPAERPVLPKMEPGS